jgi:hypothetical protein
LISTFCCAMVAGENESNRNNDNNANDLVANCRMRVIVSCLLGEIMNRTYRTYRIYRTWCQSYRSYKSYKSYF